MTLRGDSPPRAYADLAQWMEQSARLVDEVTKSANSQGLDTAALKVRLDGRDTRVEVVLSTIKHHMNEEYPYLLRHVTQHNVSAIHASNLNDVYRVSSLMDLPPLQNAAVSQSLAILKAHLEKIPPQSDT